MTRRKKLLFNTGMGLVYQVVALVCGFILPKFIIPYFGSATNGLINSITQFLTIITLCECGVGAVVQSALYKPLAEKDMHEISKILISSNRFFNKVVRLLAIYVVGLTLLYPILVRNEFDFLYTAAMIVVLAASYFVRYYFLLTYRMLLTADQLAFISLLAHSGAVIFNTVLTIVLVRMGASAHLVQLGSAIAFLLQPLIIKLYVDKHYKIDWKLKLTEEPLKQKWNGLAQHVASVVQSNAATVVLTLFSTLQNISIYSVYYLVAHGVRQVVTSLCTGMQAMLGNMLAKNERETLDRTFGNVEFLLHTTITLLFTVAGILMIPFVKIYTVNFTDANYIQPVFSIFMVLAQALYCLRIPYEMIVKAAGHYKQTQKASIIEAIINIVSAIALVFSFGLVGVAISTVLAMGYRTIYLVWYISKNIVNRPLKHFIKHMVVNLICIALMLLSTSWIQNQPQTYFEWAIMAIIVMLVCVTVSLVVNMLFFRGNIRSAFNMLFHRKKSVVS